VNPAHFTLALNTTPDAVTEIGGVPVDLAAGPYARVVVTGVDAHTPAGLSILGPSLTADHFVFEAADSEVTLGGPNVNLTLTTAGGAARIAAVHNAGFAARISNAGVAGVLRHGSYEGPDVPGLTLASNTGTVDADLNTTGAKQELTVDGQPVTLSDG